MTIYKMFGWIGQPAAVTAYKAVVEAAAGRAQIGYWFIPDFDAPAAVPASGGQPCFICCLPENWNPPARPAGVAALPEDAVPPLQAAFA